MSVHATRRAGIAFLMLVVFSFFTPADSQAASANFGWHDRHDRVSVHLPARSTRIVVGGNPYYYYDGVYYSGVPNRYMVVEAPIGAVIPRLPRHAHKIWISGRPYSRHGNIYYARVRGGWEVARPYWGHRGR